MERNGYMGLDEMLREQIADIAKQTEVARVILFGSRARGQAYARSDIDLAVAGDADNRFYFLIRENLDSLLNIDIVDMESAGQELVNEIERDGVILYEKTG